MSGEHAISRNQFGDTDSITVQGFPWCPEPKVIGLASAVANILCKRHNETLSPLDEEAKLVLDALSLVQQRRAKDRQRSAAGISPTDWPRSAVLVSSDRFERWLLKTTINLATMGKPHPEAGIFEAGGFVAKRYAEIAFGLAQFDLNEGLWFVVKVGDQIHERELRSFAFQPWTRKSDGGLVAAQVGYHGYHLWLAAKGAPAIENALRPRRITIRDVAVKIRFTWSRQLTGPAHDVVDSGTGPE
jgi:hypothetical protein